MFGHGCTYQTVQSREPDVLFQFRVIRHNLNGAKVFSKLDLANGFHQLVLDEESKGIPTFSTYVELLTLLSST